MQLRIASRQATHWLDGNFLECARCLNLGRQVHVSKVGEKVGPPFPWHTIAGALVPQLLARRPTRTPQYQ